jgi:predicted ferric reductase
MKKAACLALAGIVALTLVGSWLWIQTRHPLGNLLTGDMGGQALAWGRLAGLLAAFGILTQLTVIGRARWLEHVFGLDRLTRFHHILGFSLLFFLVAHPLLVTFGHAQQADLSFYDQAVDFWRTWRGPASATIGLGLMLAALAASAAVLAKRMRYEQWYLTHLTLYVAFALSIQHQFVCGSDITDHRFFKWFWACLYVCLLAQMAVFRFLRPARLFFRHRFAVERLVPESADVMSVYIRGRDLDAFRAEPGQFVIVRFLAKGFRWEAHPFSLSRPPDGHGLRLSIKGVGDFTKRIGGLQPGTPVLIDGAYGVFTAQKASSERVLLIAGGIGITPLRALAETCAKAGRDTVLLYGNRSAESLVFRDELEQLASAAEGRLRFIPVLSNQADWPGEHGHIDRDRLARLVPDLPERDVFLCGPPAMMKSVLHALSALGVEKSRIHYERFTL